MWCQAGTEPASHSVEFPHTGAMKLSGLIFAGWLLIHVASVAHGENWPGFRGPTGQGNSSETGLPVHWTATSNVLWKAGIPGLGWSSPIVYEDRVLLTTAVEEGASLRLICLDRRTGKVQWDKEVFRQKTTRKENQNSFATPTPVTDGRKVYVMSFNGGLAALNLDGSPGWVNQDIHFYGQHGPGVSLRVYKDILVIPFDGSSEGEDKTVGWQKPWDKSFLLAVDTQTGKVRWKTYRGLSRIAHVTPGLVSVNGRDLVVSGAGDVVQGFDLQTGELIWTIRSQGEGVVPSVVVGRGLVYATTGFYSLVLRAMRPDGRGDVTATHIAWEQKKNTPTVCSFTLAEARLLVLNESGNLACLNADTGEIIWNHRIQGHYSASPVAVGNRLYCLSEEGDTTVVDTQPEFEVIARNPLEPKCQASPAASQGCLFIRTENNLYCIGERP